MNRIVVLIFIAAVSLSSISLPAQSSYKIWLDQNLTVTYKKKKRAYYEERMLSADGDITVTIYDLSDNKTSLQREIGGKRIKLGAFSIDAQDKKNRSSGRYSRLGDDRYMMVFAEDKDTIKATFEGAPLEAEYLALFNDYSAKQEKHFRHRYRSGTWRSWYENGQAYYEIEFIRDKASGDVQMWYPDGSRMLVLESIDNSDDKHFASYFQSGQLYQEAIVERGSDVDIPLWHAKDINRMSFLRQSLPKKRKEVQTYRHDGSKEEQTVYSDSLNMKCTTSTYFDDAGAMSSQKVELYSSESRAKTISQFDKEGMLKMRTYSSPEESLRYEFSSPTDSVLVKENLAKTDNEEATDDELFYIIETMPLYPGGEAEMFKYLASNTRYPNDAKEFGLSGIVFLTFVIEKDGSISSIDVLRTPSVILTLEGARVLRNMPRWSPGQQNGKPVRVQYNIPYRFVLQ